MSPEKSLFPSDERTLEQRYEDMRAERDDLELRMREVVELLVDVAFGRFPADRLLMRFNLLQRGVKPYRTFGDPLNLEEAEDRREKMRDRQSVVYYVEMHGRVKIGYSTSFVSRMQTFYVQPSQVLAVEQGGSTLENARHRQFSKIRVAGTELFEHSPELDQHISKLRAANPNPYDVGCMFTGAV